MGVELSKTFADGSRRSWKNTEVFFCPLFALQLYYPMCVKPCDSGPGRRISQRIVMAQECVKNHRAISNSPFFSSHFKTRPASATPAWCDPCPAVWHRVGEVHFPQGVACDFPKPKQAIFLSFSLSFFPPFRLGRMQHHRPCHPELRGQQPYAFRPALAFLGKLQPAGHFLSESLREKGWDVAQAGVPLVLSRGGGRGRRVRSPGCRRGGGGLEERRDWHLHVQGAGPCRDSLMSPRAAISRLALIAVMGLSGGSDTSAHYRAPQRSQRRGKKGWRR